MKLKFTVEVFKDDDSEEPDVRAEETMTASSATVLKGLWWGESSGPSTNIADDAQRQGARITGGVERLSRFDSYRRQKADEGRTATQESGLRIGRRKSRGLCKSVGLRATPTPSHCICGSASIDGDRTTGARDR